MPTIYTKKTINKTEILKKKNSLYPFHKNEKLNQITSPEIATVGNSQEKQAYLLLKNTPAQKQAKQKNRAHFFDITFLEDCWSPLLLKDISFPCYFYLGFPILPLYFTN